MAATAPARMASDRRARVGLAVILLLGFVVRAGWAFSQPVTDESIDRLPDQREYLSLARNLLDAHGLYFSDPRFGDTVFAYRTPGYPALIAALGARVRWVQLAQATLDISTALAAYGLTRALVRSGGSRAPALVAAALVAFNPFLIYLSALLLTETLFTALLIWGMLLLVYGGRGARLRLPEDRSSGDGGEPDSIPSPRPALGTILWLIGGLILAASALVRPGAVPLTLLLGIAAAFVNRPRLGSYEAYSRYAPRWPLPVGSTMILLTALVLLPWAWRNQRMVGSWVWTATNGGITAYDGFNPDADGSSNQKVFIDAMPQLRDMGELGRSEYLKQLARRYVTEHPKRAATLAVIKAGRTWSPVPLSREFGSTRNRIVASAYALPLDVLVLVGLFSPWLRRTAKVFLLIPAIYLTAAAMLSVGSLRYRVPAEPPMAVIAGAAFAGRALRWRRAGDENTAPAAE